MSAPIPAARYIRMSDEAQQHSIENQKAAIGEYASKYGFEVVKTYADYGRRGVIANNRKAFAEVLQRCSRSEAILVYVVSRRGRFPNNYEGA